MENLDIEDLHPIAAGSQQTSGVSIGTGMILRDRARTRALRRRWNFVARLSGRNCSRARDDAPNRVQIGYMTTAIGGSSAVADGGAGAPGAGGTHSA